MSSPKAIQKRAVAEQFAWGGNSQDEWQDKASGLFAAAAVLAQHLRPFRGAPFDSLEPAIPRQLWEIPPIAFMLRGMAIECLLKAVWLARGNQFVRENTFKNVPGLKRGHDLVELASSVGVTLIGTEPDLLARLSRCIEIGRYPIPRRAPDSLLNLGVSWATPMDDDVFSNLVDRLDRLLQERLQA